MDNKTQLKRQLFGLAKKRGIPSDELRDVIVPNLTGKRISGCSEKDLLTVISHLGAYRAEATKKKERAFPEPDALLTVEQQSVIAGLYGLIDFELRQQTGFNKKILAGLSLPQTHKQGQKIIYALLSWKCAGELKARLEGCVGMTQWERGFVFTNEFAAVPQLVKFINAKGKRGQRTMPRLSILKALEIIESREK